MDPALGPPEEMAEIRDELTPMMRQYHDLCARYDDAIVLFQVGDFYETFCGAAERTARLLEIALTSREDNTGEYPMSGIPIDNAESYIEELLEAGYRVAVADQVEEPGETSGVVERAVTRVITPERSPRTNCSPVTTTTSWPRWLAATQPPAKTPNSRWRYSMSRRVTSSPRVPPRGSRSSTR